MTNNVVKLSVRSDAAALKRFAAKARQWDYEQHGMEQEDLDYIYHMSMGLLCAGRIDIKWLATFTCQILGDNAPIELLFGRYCEDMHKLCDVLSFISWCENMVKHKTV